MKLLRNNGRPIDVEPYLDELDARLKEEPGLIALYLYGSYGTPRQTPLSDVDLAVVFRAGEVPDLWDQGRLTGRVVEILREDDASVTILNHSPPYFQYRVLATGRLRFCTDEVALADFVEGVLKRHGDDVIGRRRFLREYDQALVEAYG